MKLLDILKNKEELFIIDDIEDKKTKALVKDLNASLVNIVVEYEDFLAFAASQLSGEYHQKLVNLKSLNEHYETWNGIKQAFNLAQKEEENRINKLYSNKSLLINKLKSLQNDCQKSLPVIATYHLSNGELVSSRAEHETVILGNHNTNIIEDIIAELDRDIVVEGNFDKVYATELSANYTIVENNVNMCNERINELFENKPGKAEKLFAIVNSMIVAAENLVFFETYKPTMLEVGCPNKDVDLLQKEYLKKYVPLKKQLQKALKVSFADICDIIVDENEYQNEEVGNDDFDSSLETISPTETPVEEGNNDAFFDAYSFGAEETTETDSYDIMDDNPFVGDIPPAKEPPIEEEDVFADMEDIMESGLDDTPPVTDLGDNTTPDIDDLSHPVPPKKTTKKTKKVQTEEPIVPNEEETIVSETETIPSDLNPVDLDTPLDTDEE